MIPLQTTSTLGEILDQDLHHARQMPLRNIQLPLGRFASTTNVGLGFQLQDLSVSEDVNPQLY